MSGLSFGTTPTPFLLGGTLRHISHGANSRCTATAKLFDDRVSYIYDIFAEATDEGKWRKGTEEKSNKTFVANLRKWPSNSEDMQYLIGGSDPPSSKKIGYVSGVLKELGPASNTMLTFASYDIATENTKNTSRNSF